MLYLLPYPRHLQPGDGAFFLTPDTCIVMASRGALMTTAASQLQAEIADACGIRLPILCGAARPGDVLLTTGWQGDAQGYALKIAPDGVTVCGADEAGMLHGVQTLRQVVRQCGWTLPALEAEDAPVFANRGFYHDVTRGRVPTLAWLKSLADQACLYKLNQMQLYVEHTYLFRDLTELWRIGTPLTAEEIMALDDYCADRGIELVPSLSSFGHLLELLRSKSFSHLCELPDSRLMPPTMPSRMAHHTVNASDPAALTQITAMLGEFMPLFRSKKFNICADETFDLGKGRSANVLADVGERAYYTGFVRKLCEYVESKGRTPMFWGDIVVRFADALAELPQGTICLNWGYSAAEKEDSTCILAQAGAHQYVCPGCCGWNQIMPRMQDSYENIRRMAAYGMRWGAEGLLNTDWGDYGHVNDPRFSLPGMIYGACAAWNGELLPFDEINGSISRLAYMDRSGQAVSLLARLQEYTVYSWTALVRCKDRQQGVLESDWESELRPVSDEEMRLAQDGIRRVMDGLKECAVHMDAAQRTMIPRWLLACEGLLVWNEIGCALAQNRQDAALAQRLERWLHRYEAMWREVSKESELWRIRDVAAWYADQLRP